MIYIKENIGSIFVGIQILYFNYDFIVTSHINIYKCILICFSSIIYNLPIIYLSSSSISYLSIHLSIYQKKMVINLREKPGYACKLECMKQSFKCSNYILFLKLFTWYVVLVYYIVYILCMSSVFYNNFFKKLNAHTQNKCTNLTLL